MLPRSTEAQVELRMLVPNRTSAMKWSTEEDAGQLLVDDAYLERGILDPSLRPRRQERGMEARLRRGDAVEGARGFGPSWLPNVRS